MLLAAACLGAHLAEAGSLNTELCGSGDSPARVTAVLDDLDLTLEDGRTLRLAGIDPARSTPNRPTLGDEARASLAHWLVGHAVQVRALSAPDRWNRVPSLVFASPSTGDDAPPETDARWSVAEALLDAGWARAKPDPDARACFPAFLATEGRARSAGLGLWADPYYAIVDADDRQGLTKRIGAMALVEGRFHLHQSSRRTIVTLGRGTWGLVARLATRGFKLPGKAGLDFRNLAGAEVRVRGFLDDRFGLRIDLASLDQIETLAPAPAGQQATRTRPASDD